MAESAPNLDENSTDNGVLTDMELSNSPVRSASPNLTNFEIPVLIANGSEFNGFDLPSASQQVPYFGDRNHLSFGMISTPMAMLNHFQSIFDPGSSISNQNLEQQQIVAGTTVLIMLQNAINRRSRPPGCRTVFVGNIPEKCSEEILKQIFENFGEIDSVRFNLNNKKSFAHIRFVKHESAERAVIANGSQIRVENRTDRSFCTNLHIDFAHAREDQIEYERQKRRFLSPMTGDQDIPQFSEHQANETLEKLKSQDEFVVAFNTVLAWLDRGECCSKKSNSVYNLLVTCNAQLKRLQMDREECIKKMTIYRQQHALKLQAFSTQFHLLERIFIAAKKQKNWDHFTKAQRKNIEHWLLQIEEFRRFHDAEVLRDRQEVEMDTSDDEKKEEQHLANFSHSSNCCKIGNLPLHYVEGKEGFDELQNENSLMKSRIIQLESQLASAASLNQNNSVVIQHSVALSLITICLHAYQFGASIDTIFEYITQFRDVDCELVQNLLQSHTELFGFDEDRKLWKLILFDK